MKLLRTSLLLVWALPALAAEPPAPRAPVDPAAKRIEWLRGNAVRLRSVFPADGDFTDLEPLKTILAGKEMVLLGESSQGDGTTFLAKTRLIEFLHEQMGFDVLAFESGFFDCRKADEGLAKGEEPVKAARRGLSPSWSRSEQLLPLFDYLGKTAIAGKRLELAGFDEQFTASASRDDLMRDLKAFLQGLGSKLMEGAEADAFGAVLQRLVDGEWEELGATAPLPTDGEAKFFRFLDGLKVEIGAKSAKSDGALRSDADFWQQTIESTASVARNSWDPEARTAEGRTKVRRQRDQQMARNLVWLAKTRYPGRKIVVWTGTFQAARQLKALDPGVGRDQLVESYRTMETMGDGVHRELGDKIYALGFTAYQGSVGNALQTREAEPLGRPTAGSLEDLMAQAGLENALIDFRRPPSGGEWLRKPLLSRPLGYTEMMADWGEILDGMLFIKLMEPSRRSAK